MQTNQLRLPIAHFTKDGRKHKLSDHLTNTAIMASVFTDEFGFKELGYIAGLWHDLGKYSDKFQEKLERVLENKPDIRVDHSTYGAQQSLEILGNAGKILAYIIAGHHSGLPNATGEDSSLQARLKKDIPFVDKNLIPQEILSCRSLNIDLLRKWFSNVPKKQISFIAAFWIRMLYSSLVDADFLDTEKFMNPQKSFKRSHFKNINEIRDIFIDKMEEFQKNSEAKEINKTRNEIYKACVDASQQPQGIFSLTVPTGGGKTLSSLAFALNHAVKYGLKRIIYVIPYTSIIEQNADVFRKILGDDVVIEHHSNYVQDNKNNDESLLLATENWDAPVVITTNVQFFESLFANRSSRARKIHNIANSVVILDEAQMIPTDYLYPSINALRELSSHYKTTIVLCTATQPALNKRDDFKGLENVREIIPDPQKLAINLKRVKEHYIGKIENETLVQKLSCENQVLCIVDSRKEAIEFYNLLKGQINDGNNYNLSALMCPVHRSKVINDIKQRLKNGDKCRVISTQLIEAGVDIDFPTVYRCLAGLDSISQAGGRCNREGKLPYGNLYIYKPIKGIPAIADFRPRAEESERIIRQNSDNFLSLDAMNNFFEAYYWRKGDDLDEKGIMRDHDQGLRNLDFPFKTISQKFRIIEDFYKPIIIPYDDIAENLIKELKEQVSIGILRKLQRYTIQIPEKTIEKLKNAKYLDVLNDEIYTLNEFGIKNVYTNETGLIY